MSARRLVLKFFILMLVIGSLALPAFGQSTSTAPIVLLESRGPITPVMLDYIERGITYAQTQNAQAIILQLDTPGGSVDLMNKIIQRIDTSPLPFIVYVTPETAMAASAGSLITMAADLSAMSPNTTIGAASPVGSQGEDIEQTMESKVKELLKATARNLTASRPEAARLLAEDMIETAKAVTVDEALEVGLIDIKAADIHDLMRQLDNRQVGGTTLHTAYAPELTLENSLIEQLLLLIVNPNLVFLLLAIGLQAILIELSSPGGWFAGFLGVVSLLLAVYGLGLLPVNYFGLLFIVLAFVLFILEMKTPGLGGLTAAGTISFVIGALVLFNSHQVPGFPKVSIPLVLGMAVILAASFLAVVTIGLKAQVVPVQTGTEALLGQQGFVVEALDPVGMVQAAGELWQARSTVKNEFMPVNTEVVIDEVDGLTLVVRKA